LSDIDQLLDVTGWTLKLKSGKCNAK